MNIALLPMQRNHYWVQSVEYLGQMAWLWDQRDFLSCKHDFAHLHEFGVPSRLVLCGACGVVGELPEEPDCSRARCT